ncbi:MAG: hypothetical protein RIQ81_2367 [Pseudomonadota bacterium]
MRIWIDNDGCPGVVRELVFAAAARRGLPVVVVGNSQPRIPPGKLFTGVCVPGGFDAADDHIAEHVGGGDLVITSDVPLAERIVARGATGLSAQGTVFDQASIGELLATRNLMQELRSGNMTGMSSGGGPPPFNDRAKKRFADALDRLVARMKP